jgi:hypothetical protein
MSDIDRIFARLGGRHSAGDDKRELRSIRRKGGATGSRIVEVVRLPARAAAASGGGPRRTDFRVRAETWDDGFPVRTAPPPSQAPQPVADEAPGPVAHVMPVRDRTIVEPQIEAAPAAPSEPAQTAPLPARRARRTARSTTRRVADPFDPADDGANCLRCGYAVQPARERRGLMMCAACA